MYLIRVTDQKLASEFIHLPARLNQQQGVGSKSRQKHIKALLNRKSAFFQKGKAEFWILTNFRGETIGRIAAFIENPDQPDKAIGYIGLMECINHLKAASSLFDESKEWLMRFGIRSMQGPVNLLPFQLEGIALGAGIRQATPYFSSQAEYLADLYEFYGFKAWNTQQLLSYEKVSCLIREEDQKKAQALFSDDAYKFSRIKKNDIRDKAEEIEAVYQAVGAAQSPAPRAEEVVQWLHLLFEQHFPPLIWIAYHKKKPIAFFINTYISAITSVSQKAPVWQQLFSRITNKNKSLLNLGLLVHPEFQTTGIREAMFSTLDETLLNEPSIAYESFLIMSDYLAPSQATNPSGEMIDKFVKYKYLFDQESMIDTFATLKTLSRE